jgi:hypothetical protein
MRAPKLRGWRKSDRLWAEENRMRTVATVLIAATLVFGAGTATTGCSNHTTTTRTVEQHGDGETAVKTETTSTENDDDGGGGGIISGTIDVIGFIIALPFKIVGGLIEIIF